MLTSDLTITDYAQRRRVLGRRADIRLARALRRRVSLRTKLRQRLMRGLQERRQQIRRWHNGSFVTEWITLPAAA